MQRMEVLSSCRTCRSTTLRKQIIRSTRRISRGDKLGPLLFADINARRVVDYETNLRTGGVGQEH